LAESQSAYVMVAGKPQFFPRRELETVEYSIEQTYRGLYQQLRGYLGKSREAQSTRRPANELCYARYGLWHYVVPAKRRQEPYASLQRAGVNLCGLMRILLFKRFESSVYAFRETIRRLLHVHELFLAALQRGTVATGEAAQSALYKAGEIWSDDLFVELQETSQEYSASDFEIERLQRDVQHDIKLLDKILRLVEPITPEQDAKLQTLLQRLAQTPLCESKRLIFTQYADTARYLFENLNPGGKRSDIDVIYSSDKSKARVVGRFAPKANREYQFKEAEAELFTVIATDVLAEGLNLQDCDKIINYDLHWNPVRLIQRFGRIDRIGSEHEVIYGFNFLPETGIDKHLKLQEKLRNRIREIHETIGEDAAILDQSEQLNEKAMFAIYENKEAMSAFEEEDAAVGLHEAEQMLRLLRESDPEEYQRIASLRDGIRAAKQSGQKGLFVFCAAGQYRKTYLVDQTGAIISNDLMQTLAQIRCAPTEPALKLPEDFNVAVMRIKRQFSEEVKQRWAEREHGQSLSLGQKYVLHELRLLFREITEEDVRAQINVLAKAFRGALTMAVQKEINRLRRNKVAGQALLKSLADIYRAYRMRARREQPQARPAYASVPRIVCSEALV